MKTYSVILLGHSGSGKTTFLANLYDYFIKNDRSEKFEFFEKEKGTIPYLSKIHEEYVKSGRCEATSEAISLLFEINAIQKNRRLCVKVTDVPGNSDMEYLTAEKMNQQDFVLFFVDSKETSEEYKMKVNQKVKKLKSRKIPVLLIFNQPEGSNTETEPFVQKHYKQINDLNKVYVTNLSKGTEMERIVHELFEAIPSSGKTQKEKKHTGIPQVPETENIDKQPQKNKKMIQIATVLLISLVGLIVVWTLFRGKSMEQVFTVTIQSSDGGTVTITPDKEEYEKGEIISFQAQPLETYTFSGWMGDITGENPILEKSITKNLTVKALFAHYFTLEIEKTIGGIVTVVPEKEQYEKDELITVYAQPAKFYEFMGWSGDLSVKSNTTGFSMSKNMKIKAIFKHISQAQTYQLDNSIMEMGKLLLCLKKTNICKMKWSV